MSGKLNWERERKLYRRRTLDHRWENDVPDRADRWLAAVEHRRLQQRRRRRERRSFSSTQAPIGRQSRTGTLRQGARVVLNGWTGE